MVMRAKYDRSIGTTYGCPITPGIETMLLTVISSVVAWISQVLTLVSRQVTHMQPTQYAIGLVFVICLGYVMLRGRN